MAQTKRINTKYSPVALYCSAAIFLLAAIVCGIAESIKPFEAPKKIHWCSLGAAKSEALLSKKSVLYVFSANWCQPCKKLETVTFANQSVVDFINKNFIPVLVIDQEKEKGENPPEIKRLQKQCSVTAFPTLTVVTPEFFEAAPNDLYSTGNKTEQLLVVSALGWNTDAAGDSYDHWLSNNHEHIPSSSGYLDADDCLNYLRLSTRWHKLRPDQGKVHWSPLLAVPSLQEPQLIALVEKHGRKSDWLRLEVFDNNLASQFFNANFDSHIVELKARNKWHYDDDGKGDDKKDGTDEDKDAKSSSPVLAKSSSGLSDSEKEAEEVLNRYEIKQLPAIVVLVKGEQPNILEGFQNRKNTLINLHRILKKAGLKPVEPPKDAKLKTKKNNWQWFESSDDDEDNE
ncbi:MAG: thioredoxin family protein [Candidatus Obscuribacterales bacterium]|nr:thioredoxin family protein [Candidatus Obscuribacterales bacterium]